MDVDQEQEEEDTRYDRNQGYNPPSWYNVQLTEDKLQRLERDDDDVNDYFEGFDFVYARDWIQGAGRIIGNTKRLKTIDLWLDSRSRYKWIHELCEGLSRNRTIEMLDLHTNLEDDNMKLLRVGRTVLLQKRLLP